MRKATLFLLLLLFGYSGASGQNDLLPDDRLRFHLSVGQYPATLLLPGFSTINPGINTGLEIQWNKSPRHQWVQSANLGYFYHRDLQHAVNLYSEIAYRLKFKNGFMLSPLLAGGGYLMSISDIGSYLWDEELKKYEKEGFPVKHNWMISLGASAGFEPQWKILNNKRVSLFVDYRILVQGVFVRETVPVIAYAPVRIGFSFPID